MPDSHPQLIDNRKTSQHKMETLKLMGYFMQWFYMARFAFCCGFPPGGRGAQLMLPLWGWVKTGRIGLAARSNRDVISTACVDFLMYR
jgi:hypothetical protein